MQRKWPWQFPRSSGSKAVTETDKQKWQPYCQSSHPSFLHTGHSHSLWQLPEGSFMMTALIFSCKSTSVFWQFSWHCLCTASGNCHRTLAELLPERTDDTLRCEGHFSVLRSIRMIICFSLLPARPHSCPSLKLHTHPTLFLLWDGLIMATFGYRPATITALINFSLSEEVRERKRKNKEMSTGASTCYIQPFCTAPQPCLKILEE